MNAIGRVMGDWLHWRVGTRVHFGIRRHGQCWRLFALPKRTPYFSGRVVNYSWWRLFVSVESN